MHWNINFIKNVYSGLCTWSILILWHITHSTLSSGNGAVVPQEAVTDSSFCLSRSFRVHSNKRISSIRGTCLHNLFKKSVCFHKCVHSNVPKFSVIMLMGFSNLKRGRAVFLFIRKVVCCFFLFCSLSKWQVRESLCRDLPLHQQRHLQPHWWLLPVFSWLDRRGLLSGYGFLPSFIHSVICSFVHFSHSHCLSPLLISLSPLPSYTLIIFMRERELTSAPADVKHTACLNDCCNTLCSLIYRTVGQRSLAELWAAMAWEIDVCVCFF